MIPRSLIIGVCVLFLVCCHSQPVHAQNLGALIPNAIGPTFFNATGTAPNSLGFICTYASGTTTRLDTYQDSALTTVNQNPVRLNAAGRPVNGSTEVNIFIQPLSYRVIEYAAGTGQSCNGTQVGSPIRTVDNVYDLAQLGGTTVNCSSQAGATASIKIANAIAALPSGGGVLDCRGLAGAQTLSSDSFTSLYGADPKSCTGKPVLLLLGAATFTLTTGVIIPDCVTIDFGVSSWTGAQTVSYYGRIRADLISIFGSTITVVFYRSQIVYPQWWGTVADGAHSGTGSITSGASMLTTNGGEDRGFVASDVGSEIVISGAGAAGAIIITTITGFTNSTTVTVAATASTTVTNNSALTWGSNSLNGINKAISAVNSGAGGVVDFPAVGLAYYWQTANTLTPKSNVTLQGHGSRIIIGSSAGLTSKIYSGTAISNFAIDGFQFLLYPQQIRNIWDARYQSGVGSGYNLATSLTSGQEVIQVNGSDLRFSNIYCNGAYECINVQNNAIGQNHNIELTNIKMVNGQQMDLILGGGDNWRITNIQSSGNNQDNEANVMYLNGAYDTWDIVINGVQADHLGQFVVSNFGNGSQLHDVTIADVVCDYCGSLFEFDGNSPGSVYNVTVSNVTGTHIGDRGNTKTQPLAAWRVNSNVNKIRVSNFNTDSNYTTGHRYIQIYNTATPAVDVLFSNGTIANVVGQPIAVDSGTSIVFEHLTFIEPDTTTAGVGGVVFLANVNTPSAGPSNLILDDIVFINRTKAPATPYIDLRYGSGILRNIRTYTSSVPSYNEPIDLSGASAYKIEGSNSYSAWSNFVVDTQSGGGALDAYNVVEGRVGYFGPFNTSDGTTGQGYLFAQGIAVINNSVNSSVIRLSANGGGSGTVNIISDATGTGNGQPIVISMTTGGVASQIVQMGLRNTSGGGMLIGASGTVPATGSLTLSTMILHTGTPTIGTCGTGTVTSGSTNLAGEATSTGATSCTVTFSASAFASQPFCTVTDETTAAALRISAISASSFTVANLTSNDKFMWACVGR